MANDWMKSEIKRDLIDYYDMIKSEIDISAQRLLLHIDQPNRPVQLNENEEQMEMLRKRRDEIVATNLEFVKWVDKTMDQSLSQVNEFFAKYKAGETIGKEQAKAESLKSFCVFIGNDCLKRELRDGYLIGVLLITDWYLNKNEVQYLK